MKAKTTDNQDNPGSGPGAQPVTLIVPTVHTREKLMQITGVLIDETFERVTGDRFRLREGDRERLAYVRALKELIQLHADLLQDSGAPKTVNGPPRVTTPEDLEYEQWQKDELRSLSGMLMGSRSRNR